MVRKKRTGKAIGVFDSGFGGLHVMSEIVEALPEYDYVYLGDTARIPYGNRSQDIVYEFTRQAVDFLFSRNCEIVVVACNTVSSDALHRIQTEYLPKYHPTKRVLGVIIPAVEYANLLTKNGNIGVIATEGTVASGAFLREMGKINPKIKMFQNPCPLLVPIVESGEDESEIVETVLKRYLRPLLSQQIDTLILGCTHYGILEKQITKIVGKNVQLASEAKIVASKLKDYLVRHPEIESILSKNKTRFFYSTDLTERFQTLGSKFYGEKISVEKVQLD